MGKAAAKRIRVGIIGANPDRGWAAQAHIPALTSLSDDFEITALSTSRRESADAASKPFGVPAALDNVNREWTPDRMTVVLGDEALGF
jgi:predicted dehydrogenase